MHIIYFPNVSLKNFKHEVISFTHMYVFLFKTNTKSINNKASNAILFMCSIDK